MKVGIIGATGWLGSATGRHLLSTGRVAPGDLVVLNRSGPQGDYHGHAGVVWAQDVPDLVARSEVIIVSVRPGDWPGLALRAPGRLILSFMAGVSLSVLGKSGGRIVRVMPNAAVEMAQSYSPWVAGAGVTEADRATVRDLLQAIGHEDELPDEGQIDLMTASSGAGAAYPALMLMAATDWLMAKGVARDVALRAAEAMVCGGAQLMAGQPEGAPAMVAAYRDYRGTTAAGIAAAEAAGFAASIGAALEAATAAARRMTKAAAGQGD